MNTSENISEPQGIETDAVQKAEDISEQLESVGVSNALWVVPGFILSALWCLIWIVVGTATQDNRLVPLWAWIIGILPAVLNAVIEVYGVAYSIVNLKQRNAVKCLILSIVSLLAYTGLWCWLIRFCANL